MMKKIENVHQLRTEIDRLKITARRQEQQIKNDLHEIREDLKPANLLWKAVSSLTGIMINRNEFFQKGIMYGLSIIVQRFILKSETNIESRVYDFVDTIFERVKGLVNKFTGHEAKRAEREEEREEF
jgi:hypothetical protein